jgi:hypothetical protein
MTPEERFRYIEKILQSSAEQHDRFEKRQDRLEKQQERQSQDIDKLNDAARSLIVVARTCLDSLQEFRDLQRKDHEEWTVQMKELRDAQAATDERLNILIDTADRFFPRQDHP